MKNSVKLAIEVMALLLTFFAILELLLKVASSMCGANFYAVATDWQLIFVAFLAIIVTMMAYHAYNCICK